MPTLTRRPPYQAHLRVYEPVAALSVAERDYWHRYAASAPSRDQIEAELFAQTVGRLAGNPPVPVPAVESRHALVMGDGEGLLISPVQPRLQVWRLLRIDGLDESVSAGERRGSLLPEDVVPPALREQAAADLAAHAEGGGETRLFCRTAAWQVPLAWFILFAAQERELVLEPPRSLSYRTTMAEARSRAAKGLRTAQRSLGDLRLTDEIETVARWLEEFHPRSRVELDYGGLVQLLDDVHLRGDDSASDVGEGLAALAEGDAGSAAAAYRRWTTRWRRVHLLSRAS